MDNIPSSTVQSSSLNPIQSPPSTVPPTNPIGTSSDLISKSPWPWWAVLVFSLLFGFLGSFFIVWQSLKRMGKENEARTFLTYGGVTVVIITALLFLLPENISPNSGISSGLAIIFPAWFYSKYFKQWQKDNPGKTKFTWSLIGWGLLGLILFLAFLFLVATIFPY